MTLTLISTEEQALDHIARREYRATLHLLGETEAECKRAMSEATRARIMPLVMRQFQIGHARLRTARRQLAIAEAGRNMLAELNQAACA